MFLEFIGSSYLDFLEKILITKSKTTDPIKATKILQKLKPFIDPYPNEFIINPPIKAPMIPTTIFAIIPIL